MAQSGKQDKARKLKTHQVWYRFTKAIDVNLNLAIAAFIHAGLTTRYRKESL